jgi:hypothetical protein
MPVVKDLWQAVSPKRLYIPLLLYQAVGIIYTVLEADGQTSAATVFKAFLMPILFAVVLSFHAELPPRVNAGLLMCLALSLAWAGDISMAMSETYLGMIWFAAVRILFLYLYREMNAVTWGKVALSAVAYSISSLCLQIVLWISQTAPLALQISGTLYMFLVLANGYVFCGAGWWILTAGLLFAMSDFLIALRLVQEDGDIGVLLSLLDMQAYIWSMMIFAYVFVYEKVKRDQKAISEVRLLDEEESAPEATTYQFEEKDTALETGD